MTALRVATPPITKYTTGEPERPIHLPARAELRLREHAETILGTNSEACAWVAQVAEAVARLDVRAAFDAVPFQHGAYDVERAMGFTNDETKRWSDVSISSRQTVLEWCATVTAADGLAITCMR